MRNLTALAITALLSGCVSGTGQDHANPRANLEGPQLSRLYAAIERVYRSEDRFRTDYDPSDAPYDAATLTKNFAHVAQRSETQTIDGKVIIAGDSIPLTRWDAPLRIWTVGETPPDTAHLATLTQRVSRLIRLPVDRAVDAQDANIFILIADADERRELTSLIRSLAPGNDAPLVDAWPERPEFPCIARVFIDPSDNTLQWAMILVKSELSGEFRKSCLTEEFVQSLGLFNDGSEIRPSIFNDDAEFIELTRHDEYLLQILYDRRLRPGMLRGETEPIVRTIAAELLADAAS